MDKTATFMTLGMASGFWKIFFFGKINNKTGTSEFSWAGIWVIKLNTNNGKRRKRNYLKNIGGDATFLKRFSFKMFQKYILKLTCFFQKDGSCMQGVENMKYTKMFSTTNRMLKKDYLLMFPLISSLGFSTIPSLQWFLKPIF